jgi:apolipoprotein N-acyltransferase
MLLCILSAILLILSFPNFNLEFLAWIGLVPLFFALENKSGAKAFWLAYLCAVIFYAGTTWWLIYVTFAGLVILILYLSLYFAIFAFVLVKFRQKYRAKKFGKILLFLLIPSLWVILEYLRNRLFTGFGWAFLGYSQYQNLAMIQIADLTGVYGVSFLVVLVNWQLQQWLQSLKNREKGTAWSIRLTLLIVFCVFAYGYSKLFAPESGEKLKVSVVQGNIPQEIKWDYAAKEEIFARYLKLTEAAAQEKPDLIIWPETSLPGFLPSDLELRGRIEQFCRKFKIPLLIGAPFEEGEKIYNTAALFSAGGEILERYDKVHLVPFGEFVPPGFAFLRKVVEIGDFSAGKEYTVFRLGEKIRFSVLTCFEDIFPHLVRKFKQRGAGFLVNMTNDAWFKKSSAPFQHAQASVFRAVEFRSWLVRAANSGYSCFISPQGRIVQDISVGEDIFVAGFASGEIFLNGKPSFYQAYGDLFCGVCLLLVVLGLICFLFP